MEAQPCRKGLPLDQARLPIAADADGLPFQNADCALQQYE
jgi:hypothetical protein